MLSKPLSGRGSKHEAVPAAPDPGFAVYVHWPFCLAKCPYCDFNSHVRSPVDHARWARALSAEIDYFAAATPGRRVSSIFFGGGTPSLMAPATVAAAIERIALNWPLAPAAEITLEANPTSVEAAKFRDFLAAGVNRVSLGVQALDDDALKFLGRGHDVAQAVAAVALARRIFPRTSFDLIYARPGQSGPAWRAELDRALDLSSDHLSLYQLTIERNTGFHGRVKRGEFSPLDQDANAALYRITQERCARAGLPAYEISNHARPGGECRHNLVYWRYGDYVGVGPGAHGRLTSWGDRSGKGSFRQWKKPERWLEQVEAQGDGTEASEAIAPPGRAVEALMMGLRLTEGVYFENFRATTGLEFDSFVASDKLRRLIAGGFLARDRFRIRATPKGLPLLNALLAEIVP